MKIRLSLVVVLVSYALFVWWFVGSLESSAISIADSQEVISRPSPVPEAIVRFDNVTKGLIIPSWTWLNTDRNWALASNKSPIDQDYRPKLTELTVKRGNWLPDSRVHPDTIPSLEKLFSSASQSAHPLIITSAYRSADSQQDLLTSSINDYGEEWANSHIAMPGESEHQLGLAVDISSYNPDCELAFSSCWLKDDTASWLAENAHKFGFILRYPPNKSHITGVSHEPWHFRYVGEYMATYVKESGLTLDEIILNLQKQRT